MLIGTVDHNAEAELAALVRAINAEGTGAWGILCVPRDQLQTVTNDAILLALKPALGESAKANIFFADSTIYIAWSGMQRRTERELRRILQKELGRADISPAAIVYVDPFTAGDELIVSLKKNENPRQSVATNSNIATVAAVSSPVKMNILEKVDFAAFGLDLVDYKKLLERRREHKKMHMLVIEDQPFLRQLLYEALRAENNVFTAAGVKEGLEIYLKEAPHIVFLDIGLPDASGHALAKKLRDIDPGSYVVMVTGSREKKDVEAAKENGVYGFIVKPFTKAKIHEVIQRYGQTHAGIFTGQRQ